jgi:hypothetical protein
MVVRGNAREEFSISWQAVRDPHVMAILEERKGAHIKVQEHTDDITSCRSLTIGCTLVIMNALTIVDPICPAL